MKRGGAPWGPKTRGARFRAHPAGCIECSRPQLVRVTRSPDQRLINGVLFQYLNVKKMDKHIAIAAAASVIGVCSNMSAAAPAKSGIRGVRLRQGGRPTAVPH